MNFPTVFCVILVIYSMNGVAAEKCNSPDYKYQPQVIPKIDPPMNESEILKTRGSFEEIRSYKPPCNPRLIRTLLAQTNRTIDIIAVNLSNFEITQQNMDFKLRNIDTSLNNVQESTATIGDKMDNQDELLFSFNETLANSDPNCNEVDNKLSTKADSTLGITAANNQKLLTVEQQQNALAEQLKKFKTTTEASLKALSALITDKVIPKLKILEQSLKNMEANEEKIKMELKLLCRLKTLSENIFVSTKLLQGPIIRLNDTQGTRLVTLKDEIEQTIIENSNCSMNHPLKQIVAEVETIETKLVTCQNAENLLKKGIQEIHDKNNVNNVRTNLENLKSLIDKKTNEALHNQRNCDYYNSYSTYGSYPFYPNTYRVLPQYSPRTSSMHVKN